MFTTPHLDSHSTTDPKPEILSAVLTGNRISHDQRNVRGIMHVHVCRKYDIFRQRRLNNSEVGGEIAFRRVYPARAYSTVVVHVFLVTPPPRLCLFITKNDIFRQRRLNHSGVGGRKIAFRRVYPARAYTTLVVLVIY